MLDDDETDGHVAGQTADEDDHVDHGDGDQEGEANALGAEDLEKRLAFIFSRDLKERCFHVNHLKCRVKHGFLVSSNPAYNINILKT